MARESPASPRTPRDRFWFGTQLGQNGLTRHEPDRVPPRAVIIPQPPNLSANRLITLNYVSAFGENQIEFETTFDGVRRAWSGLLFFQRAGVQDGVHDFSVRARDRFGNLQTGSSAATFEVDGTPPLPTLQIPVLSPSNEVRDTVHISGTTDDLRFRAASVLVRPLGETSWQPPAATLLYADSIPVTDSLITSWPTNGWAEGNYEIAAFVVDTLGLVGNSGARVVVDNLFPFVNQTSPAEIRASGGNVTRRTPR